MRFMHFHITVFFLFITQHKYKREFTENFSSITLKEAKIYILFAVLAIKVKL